MSRYIDADKLMLDIRLDKRPTFREAKIPPSVKETMFAYLDSAPSIDIVKCVDCRKCKERGGHANCNGYLYCTRQKTLVDEDCFCSWGERREP